MPVQQATIASNIKIDCVAIGAYEVVKHARADLVSKEVLLKQILPLLWLPGGFLSYYSIEKVCRRVYLAELAERGMGKLRATGM